MRPLLGNGLSASRAPGHTQMRRDTRSLVRWTAFADRARTPMLQDLQSARW